MKYIYAILTVLLFTATAQANSDRLDLTGLGLVTGTTYDGCKDLNRQIYQYRSKISAYQKGYYYYLQCDRYGHDYNWEVTQIQKSLYNEKVSEDGLGCRDSANRIYDTGVIIQDVLSFGQFYETKTYICREKNNKHYFTVKTDSQ